MATTTNRRNTARGSPDLRRPDPQLAPEDSRQRDRAHCASCLSTLRSVRCMTRAAWSLVATAIAWCQCTSTSGSPASQFSGAAVDSPITSATTTLSWMPCRGHAVLSPPLHLRAAERPDRHPSRAYTVVTLRNHWMDSARVFAQCSIFFEHTRCRSIFTQLSGTSFTRCTARSLHAAGVDISGD